MMTCYRLYVKDSEMRTYEAITGDGTTTRKLIYAVFWNTLEEAMSAFNGLSQNNPQLHWQLRDTNNKVIKSHSPAIGEAA